MLPRNVKPLLKNILFLKEFHTSTIKFEKYENPIWRTLKILANDLSFRNNPKTTDGYIMEMFPKYVDILVIGGGAIGSSVAYWLKEKSGLTGLKLAVLEKDPSYIKSSMLLGSGVRQQFSLPENIQMSLFGTEFMRTLRTRFGKETDAYFTPNGYLTLANEESAQQLLDNQKLQKELGALNVILSANDLKERYPWLNVEDVEIGCLGLEKEGWCDPWSLLCLLKSGAVNCGAHYITAELIDFVFRKRYDIIVDGVEDGTYEGIDEAIVKLPDGEVKSIKFAICVLACGADSDEVAKLARIGTGTGILSVPLPIEKRKKIAYYYQCQNEEPGLNSPFIADYIGSYFRRDGLSGTYIGGLVPMFEEDLVTENLEANEEHFKEKVLPKLAHRVPYFVNAKIRNSWSCCYDYNYYDENGIVGPHPYYHNMYLAAGFNGHGIQQVPAIGRAISELILDGDFQTIGLNRFGFDRLIVDKPMLEASNIV